MLVKWLQGLSQNESWNRSEKKTVKNEQCFTS